MTCNSKINTTGRLSNGRNQSVLMYANTQSIQIILINANGK